MPTAVKKGISDHYVFIFDSLTLNTTIVRIIYLLLFSVMFLNSQMIFAQKPSIDSFSPTEGAVGTVFIVTGSNLKDSTSIKIGATPALVLSNTGVKLTAMVMPGSVSGTVNITTHGGTDSSESFVISASKPPVNQIQKLTGTGAVFNADLGIATTISADNNTIALGGAADSIGKGAVWVYSRNSNGEWLQYGKKLVPVDASSNAQVGQKLNLSADGNTLITGGFNDSSGAGAAWIFVKDTNGLWIEQSKLVGTNAAGLAKQGCSVAISADGNTVVMGGYADSATSTTLGVGAIWVFVRDTANVWKQQGNKLVGNGAWGSAAQGYSVAISADGSTIMSGGITDSNVTGAVWVFVKDSANVWKEQASRLHVTNENNPVAFGFSLALNANGNTAIIGSDENYNVFGGAWIFIRDNNGVWMQQGDKLIGTDTAYTGGKMRQGRSVAISADGNTVISGGYGDNGEQGGAWIFTRSNNIWSQYGYKLLGSNVAGPYSQQGYYVSISADGNIGLLGGPADNYGSGACWVFSDLSTVLPVKIGKFMAYLSGNGVQTGWKAYNEINMDHYVVERSVDGYYFKALGNVHAKGNAQENNYYWFDPSPLNGNNFYRLKAIDKNTVVEYSPIIKITQGTAGNSIKVFPNPTIDKSFYIQLNNLSAGDYTFSLYNSLGQKVYTAKYAYSNGSEALKINLKNIREGIYHVEITGNKHTYQTQVLIR